MCSVNLCGTRSNPKANYVSMYNGNEKSENEIYKIIHLK